MDEQSVPDKSISSPSLQKQLPPVKQLIVESWELLTKKALKLMFLGLLSIAIYFGMFMLGMIAIVGVGAMNFSSFSDSDAVLEILSNPSVIGTAVSVFIVWIVGMIVVGTALQAGMLMLLKDPKEETSVIAYFKQGFSFIVPLLVVSAITFFIVFGSFFVFIIPAFIIGIFLMFTMYTVVLDNKKGMEAIKMSIGVVSQHFGAVMGRVILLWLLSFAVQMLIGALPNEEPSAAIFYMLISFVASFVIGWFGITYAYRLYEHAKAAYDEKKPTSMTWMWVVSVLGWVIGAMIISGIISAIGSEDLQKTIQDSIQQEMEAEFNLSTR